MTKAGLIKALRNCSSPTVGSCMDCPYCKGVSCKWQMMEDAADALEAAEKRIAEQQKQIAQLYMLLNNRINEIEELLPKEGEWIEQDDGNSIYHKCSVCGKNQYNVLLEMMQGDYHYCPNCGSVMKGGCK